MMYAEALRLAYRVESLLSEEDCNKILRENRDDLATMGMLFYDAVIENRPLIGVSALQTLFVLGYLARKSEEE